MSPATHKNGEKAMKENLNGERTIFTVLIAILACVSLSNATTYYVDFAGGDDTRSGASPGSAWKHCPGDPQATSNAADAVLKPGDIVRFKGGVAYRGSINNKWSGAETAPITYDGNSDSSWGEGRAVIDASEPLGNWTRCLSQQECDGNPNWENIYWSLAPDGVMPFTANLYEGDSLLALAQEPDQPDPFFFDNVEYFTKLPAANMTRTTLTDPAMFSSGDWDSVSALIWTLPNVVALRTILTCEQSTATITFDTINDPSGYNKYAVINGVRLIDRPGEFAVDRAARPDGSRRVYLWPLSWAAPAHSSITVSIRSYGFNIGVYNHITVKGFEVRKCSGGGMTGGVGIGSISRPWDTTITGIRIIDNIVRYGRGGETRAYGGIFIDKCVACTVSNNSVRNNVNAIGIFMPGARNSHLRSNEVVRNGSTGILFMGCRDSRISGNLVADGIGTHANGISVYSASERIVVERNRVVNSNICFTMEQSRDVDVVNNLFVGSGAGYLCAAWGGMAGNVNIFNNTIVNSANHASVYVSGCDSDSLDVVLRNNILDGGGCGARSNNLYVGLSWSQGDRYGWSLAEGEMVENDMDKIFIDAAAGDYRLRESSAAIDRGADLSGAGVTVDLAGNARPNGKGFDAGAYEYSGNQTGSLPEQIAVASELARYRRLHGRALRRQIDQGTIRAYTLRGSVIRKGHSM
ncbi:MAG: hypothetical protein GF350_02585, partial [Chitinivibrionales bacterium]|nr:hypothetical protein [Chitinivibrionales bacterium]